MKKDTEEIVISLDIGTTKIVALVAKRNHDGKIEILGVGKSQSRGVHRGVVNNITNVIESIKLAVSSAQEEAGIKIEDVIVGIAGEHIKSKQHADFIIREKEDRVVDKNDLDRLMNQVSKLVMNPGEKIINILPQDFTIDGENEIYEPIGMYGVRLGANFHIVIGKVSSIRNIVNCIREADLNLLDITLEPLASAEAVLNEEEKEAGVVLVDIGGGTTDVAIFKDKIIRHTAVIPLGGDIITEDITEELQIIKKQAEKLKIRMGSAIIEDAEEEQYIRVSGINGREPKLISVNKFSRVINKRIKEIITNINLEINNYYDISKSSSKKLIAGIVITGGGAKLRNIRQLVEFITELDCRIGTPNQHIYISNNEKNREIIEDTIYSTSIGLALIGFKNNKIRINNKKEKDSSVEVPEHKEVNKKKKWSIIPDFSKISDSIEKIIKEVD